MNIHIIKPILAATFVMLSASLISANQLGNGGSGAAGTGPAEDTTVVPEDSVLAELSKAPPVATEHRDSAFVWNIAFGAYRYRDYDRKKLELSKQQASEFTSLCRDYDSDWTMQLLKQRRAPDDGIIDVEETKRMMQAENLARMAKFRDDFMAILTDTQRDDVYRRTLRSGGAFAMLHPELRTRFQLTEEQVKEISEIRDTNWEPLSPHFMTATDDHYRTMAEPFMDAAWGKLTDDQKLQVEQFIAKISKSHVAMVDPLDGTTALPGGISEQIPAGRVVQGGSMMITWSENNDELRGFSKSLGEWETLKIEKQDSIVPVLGSDVAAVRIGDSIAAFSGVKGWWDVIPLSKGSSAQSTVSDDLVQIRDDSHFYTFAAAKGRWTSQTDPELQAAILELRLQNVLDTEDHHKLNEWLNSLPRYKARGLTFNFKSSFPKLAGIYSARHSWLREAEDKLNELAAQPEPQSSSEVIEDSSSGPDAAAHLESRIASLREELRSLDGDVNPGANDADQDPKTREARKQALRKLVEKSFDLRQELQHLEAQRMQLKLQLIEANLDARDKNREDIIQRRVDELLDSSVKDPDHDTGETTIRTANPGTPATRTPIGPTGPPHLPLGGPAGLASHTVPNSDARIQWPQPVEIVEELRNQKNFVVKYLNELKDSETYLRTWSKPLAELKSEETATSGMSDADRLVFLEYRKGRIPVYQKLVDRHQRDWNRAWSAYQSKLRLLRLDLEEAKLAHESLAGELNRMRQHPDQGAFSISEVQRTESRLAIARINVQRAEEMLQLYADIETTEPELNPASLDAADSTKPDSSPKSESDVQDPLLQDFPDNPPAPPEKAVKP